MRTEYGLLLPKIVSECCELVEVMSLIVRSNFWYTVYVPLFLSATFCPTLSNPVRWQNWMAAFLGYTLRMKMLFHGWPVMVHDMHMRRRRLAATIYCGRNACVRQFLLFLHARYLDLPIYCDRNFYKLHNIHHFLRNTLIYAFALDLVICKNNS